MRMQLQISSGRTGCPSLDRWRVRGLRSLLFQVAFCLLLSSSVGRSSPPTDEDLSHLKRSVVTNYAAVVFATYQECWAAVEKMKTSVDDFIAKPSEQSLSAARQTWLAARTPYSQTEAFRFYDGPIDQVEPMINAWPIDENYIDQVTGEPDAGVINAVAKFPEVSTELILALNEKEGKKNISAGFHAIEFLLWGQDTDVAGPGNRSWRDYTDEAKNGKRRCDYLRIVAALLRDTLQTVAADWSPTISTNYRAKFLAMNPDEALANILKGIGALSGPELAGERLTSPYETKEQEEEQDCFSDNTRNDLIDDAIGIQNVYLGRHPGSNGPKVSGPGVHDLLARVNPEFAAKLAAQIEASVVCARNIPQPFDQAILGADTSPGRIAVKNAATTFQAESDMIAKAAKLLAIKLNL